VLVGRIAADTVRLLVVATVIVTVGNLIGFRFQGGPLMAVAMVLAAVAFGSAMCWVQAIIGLAVPNVETAQSAGFVWLFPVVFLSSAFTPVATMPGWLQVVARNNPVTLVANLLRALAQGRVLPGSSWPATVAPVLLWIVGIIAVAAPTAVARFRRV
jgi:ABC-2 type transport system permease protein/oleandomycin transport system permease protein